MNIRLLSIVAGLPILIASGPALAGSNQAQQNTCDPACARAAEAMAKQQSTETHQRSSETGSESSSKTNPSYSPSQVHEFLKKCCREEW